MVSDAAHGVDSLRTGLHQHENYPDDSGRSDHTRGIETVLDGRCFQIRIDREGLWELIPICIASKSSLVDLEDVYVRISGYA